MKPVNDEAVRSAKHRESSQSVGSPVLESQGVPELAQLPKVARMPVVLQAIVLAGGSSTRMGRPKALLETPDGRPFLVRIVETLRAAGLAPVTVVTGVHHEAVVSLLASRPELTEDVRVIRNTAPERGQLSSLLAGLEAAAGPGTEGVLVTLVDVPLVSVETVLATAEAWRQRRAPVTRPAIGEAHGHPVIFDRQALDALRGASLAQGAKAVIRAYGELVHNVPVTDRGCLVDVDTPDDYRRLTIAP